MAKTKTDKTHPEAALRADVLPLTNAQRAAFRDQSPPELCRAMADGAKSQRVLDEARDWAGVIAKALRKHPGAIRRYGPARFAWFLECIAALDDARERKHAGNGSTDGAASSVERAHTAALATRADLLDALTTMATGNEADERALGEAQGEPITATELARSLRTLAALAREWLRRDTERSRALAASVALLPNDAENAENAADALVAALHGAAERSSGPPADAADVRLAEGRVLLEMRLAARLFGRAHHRAKGVPRLTPGPATRDALTQRDVEERANGRAARGKSPPADAPLAIGI